MAPVPQKILEWLYRVLSTSNYNNQAYQDPTRTYHDVVQLLTQYPNFAPKTDVYTYENGASALLLNLSGTVPVTFRGAVYQFPITIWIPNTYPREPPIVYVTPTSDMLVRPGQHVSGEGRVYHHYLAHWMEARNRSTVVDFLHVLRTIFAKDPPVTSKHAGIERPIPVRVDAVPPAVPPLPPQLARQEARPESSQAPSQSVPPLPPKPIEAAGPQARHISPAHENVPPPLPPLPDGFGESRRISVQPPASNLLNGQNITHPAHQANPHSRPIPNQLQQGYENSYRPQDYSVPVSPLTQALPGPPTKPQNHGRPPYTQPVAVQPQWPPSQPTFTAQHGQPLLRGLPSKKPPTQDLLTSPFDLELPSQSQAAAPPPIPPNPEKDFVMNTLSRTITQSLHDNINKTKSGLQPLDSQSQALHAAIATLKTEITTLNALHSSLQSNTSILQQSLQRADSVIADARARISSPAGPSTEPPSSASLPPPGFPAIDEIVVPPTVVGKQIYDLVADERGIERAMYALQTGLVKGRVALDTWAKLTRSLAREAFLKKALIRKAGVGMGLSVDET
ncbi:suppressor protein stp22 of temperature-sensitive alpha-factor receptor and arginine permease [Ophidiomyces ophidiicola]|nr:suppressor protein stp22 of temperature-sensitive alpha-factor receptor and arginine permease [Ophidiomyces ophidiicola]KAI1983862.1 suppressor protein stp22 of temperature-sensitive alpha-factor receptor and arginine permease [Ophidiomyces ophidiicola]KAI1984405.1 suppressor protein stp22 of temperature-sensitive alpha-factor receptor and arginine permease [Ophidiomyces ophidiicola]KAI1989334.1 suppressor protein stp22 of temperature-sensitive alpha-factor receptor and arginine permease [Oph